MTKWEKEQAGVQDSDQRAEELTEENEANSEASKQPVALSETHAEASDQPVAETETTADPSEQPEIEDHADSEAEEIDLGQRVKAALKNNATLEPEQAEDDLEDDDWESEKKKRKKADTARTSAGSSGSIFHNHRKLIIALGAVLVGLIILIAALYPIVTKPERKSPYLGTWQISTLNTADQQASPDQIAEANGGEEPSETLKSFRVTFEATGSCTAEISGEEHKGTWHHTDDGLVMTDENKDEIVMTDPGDGTLQMEIGADDSGNSYTITLIKQETAETEAAAVSQS